MEADNENEAKIHLTRHTKKIAQQRNRAFSLDTYQELRRGIVKKAVQAKRECDEQPTIHDASPNQKVSQRGRPRRSAIRTRKRGNKNEDLGLGFAIPAKYQYFSTDVDSEDTEFYPPEWFPNMDHVDQVMLDLGIDNKGKYDWQGSMLWEYSFQVPMDNSNVWEIPEWSILIKAPSKR